MKGVPLLGLALILTGCTSGSSSYLPMSTGNAWSYQSRTGLNSSVVDVKVSKKVSVGTGSGFELTSQAGASRVSWQGDTLVASQLAGTFYSPPIPIFVQNPSTWEGRVTFMGKESPGKAKVTVADTDTKAGSKTYPAKLVTLTIDSAGTQTEVSTWYVNRIGIVRQEQRTDGLLVNRLSYLSGPGG